MKRICIFGLGEAGSLYAKDLIALGYSVAAFDPASVETPKGSERFDQPEKAVVGAQIVMALTASHDAEIALQQAFTDIPDDALYADFSTASAKVKQRLAAQASKRNIAFADVALLAVVPGKGIRTDCLVSGSGAQRFVEEFTVFEAPVESLGENAGDAATRKLLRSVFMKGLAAVTIEAMKAAEKEGLSDWLWGNLSTEIAQADEVLLHRLVTGTELHAQRRLGEMQAAAELLSDLGVDPVMTSSTVENLRKVIADGLPKFPELNSSSGPDKTVGGS